MDGFASTENMQFSNGKSYNSRGYLMAFEADMKLFRENQIAGGFTRENIKEEEAYLGDMSQPCCINVARENHKLFTILKSLAMVDVGMCGEP